MQVIESVTVVGSKAMKIQVRMNAIVHLQKVKCFPSHLLVSPMQIIDRFDISDIPLKGP